MHSGGALIGSEDAHRSGLAEVLRGRLAHLRWHLARGGPHDSLTHSISVIQVQAGVAVHLAHKRGEEVPPALAGMRERVSALGGRPHTGPRAGGGFRVRAELPFPEPE